MNEQLSALIDGELDDDEAEHTLAGLRTREEDRRCWSEYQLIGDALRRSGGLERDVTARVMEALLEEPVVLAPPRRRSAPLMQRALALAASIAGVAVVAALSWSGQPQTVEIVRVQPVPVQLASSGLHEYVVAHQSHVPNTAVQGAARYIRTVALDPEVGTH